MMKIVVRGRKRVKLRGGGLPHPNNSVSKHCAGGCAWQYLRLCWPYPRAKSKSDQSLRKRVQPLSPFALGLWENRKYHNCGPGRARTMIISPPSKLFYRSHLEKKLACCPQQELRTMHSEVFTPHPLMPTKFEKRGPSRKARNYCKVMSSAQEPLSVICAKFLRLQVAK